MDREVLDHRVGQQGIGNRLQRLVIDAAIDFELEVLALPDAVDPLDSQAAERAQDRLTLGVEDLRLEHYIDDNASHGHSLIEASARLPSGLVLIGPGANSPSS